MMSRCKLKKRLVTEHAGLQQCQRQNTQAQPINGDVDVIAAPCDMKFSGYVGIFTSGRNLTLQEEKKIFHTSVVFNRRYLLPIKPVDGLKYRRQLTFRNYRLFRQHYRVRLVNLDVLVEEESLGIVEAVCQNTVFVGLRGKFLSHRCYLKLMG
jgi:hypothetical protein